MISFVSPAKESVVWWYKATLERWIDGDSAVVTLDKGFNEFRHKARVRLAMVNKPRCALTA